VSVNLHRYDERLVTAHDFPDPWEAIRSGAVGRARMKQRRRIRRRARRDHRRGARTPRCLYLSRDPNGYLYMRDEGGGWWIMREADAGPRVEVQPLRDYLEKGTA
jgi:hypothetical protein